MKLTLDQALQKGIEAHKAGKFQEADRIYTAILKSQPKDPNANHNMGVLAVEVGMVEAALPFFKTALENNASITQFWLSYLDALIKLDRIADANKVLDQAKSNGAKGDAFEQTVKQLESRPSKNSNTQEPSQERLQSLINLYTKGHYQEALGKSSQLLGQYPNSINLYNIIGASNQELGKLDEAIVSYTKALSIKPDYAEAYYNMGIALKEQGKLEEAIEAYNKAISIAPNYADAHYNMGLILQGQQKLDTAIDAYTKALSIKPDYAEAYYNMGIALADVIFTKPNRDLQKAIVSLLEYQTFVRPKNIVKPAISLLKLEPTLQKYFQMVEDEVIKNPLDIILDLNEVPLLLKLMSVCPLPDLELERLLTNLRKRILSNISSVKEASPELLRFQSALALQCFTNEYIYETTDNEDNRLQSLEARVEKDLKNNNQPSPWIVLILASYKALNEFDWCKFLVVTDHIGEVYSRQVEEPLEEEKLKQKLPILNEITDSISSEVRAQYEESPYPRWVNAGLHLQSSSILEMVKTCQLRVSQKSLIEVTGPNILVAGCGTGQHSADTATRYQNSAVLAVDLSLSSLSYAKRKTEELGIKNIEYMQADILDLGNLKKQFDIIESVGVLHHMEDPMQGWAVLTDCLKPGGLMKIGLYSELARKHIVKMRKEISKAGIGSNATDMKSFRNVVMQSDKDHHKVILNSHDFYSLSTLKDLLFHVQEHRFTIPLIKDHLDNLGLKFCGFEARRVVSHFKKAYTKTDDPYDLDKWQAYEQDNPTAFAGMYQFWCQKID